MKQYLKEFKKHLETSFKGSLVKVSHIKRRHAKEYLNRLAREGAVERVSWGWYWVPARVADIYHFLRLDANFKVISGQTAASIWNGDFIHRDMCVVKVRDRSFSRALEHFCESKGWSVHSEYTTESLRYVTVDGMFVEVIDDTIMDCLRRYAFQDAFATLRHNMDEIDLDEMKRRRYWERLHRSNVRLRQVLEHGWSRLSGRPARGIGDEFVQRDVDDALDRVIAIG